jgi:hypothetical protein
MDRRTVYPDQIPFETDILSIERYVYEALGLFALDVAGSATVVSRLACAPTVPGSLNVLVGPGSIYTLKHLDDTAWGGLAGDGGLLADVLADHQILKQGLLRDTQMFACPAPVTAGQTVRYLIEAQFQEADSAGVTSQFYNTANPNAPITNDVSPDRLNKCVLQLKTGAPAATGSETTPATDAGWVPVWVISVTYGITAVTAGMITRHPSAPLLGTVGGGGGGGGSGLTPWTVVTATGHTFAAGERVLFDMTGGAYSATLPAAPAVGDEIWGKVNGATNNLTLNRNGKTIAGVAANLVLDKDNVTFHLVYDGGTWRV